MSLGTINAIKGGQNAYQPLLLAAVKFKDSLTAPTTLLLSSHNLNAGDGGFAPNGISGFPYNGTDFQTRITNEDIAATAALSSEGIDITPTVTLTLGDPDKTMWGTYEKLIGFKGATLTLYYVFWDVGTNNFSDDYRTLFTGVCNPGRVSDEQLVISAESRTNMNQTFLPVTRIQRRCPWVFPDTTGLSSAQAAALQQIAADDPSADTWHCGFSNLATGGNAVGNTPSGDITYRSCNYTLTDCLARLGSGTNIVHDSSNRPTARYGGVQWDPPNSFVSRGYGQPTAITGFNAINEGKYNDYVPMGWGTYWIDPVVMNITGDANLTRMEVLLGTGQFSNVRTVVCNDIAVDATPGNGSGAPNSNQISLQLFWHHITTGDRTGAVNGEPLYDGKGDCYGSLKIISITVPRQLTPSSSIPRIRVLCDGPLVRVYSDPVTFTDQFSTNPAWVLMDQLVWSGWTYSALDIQTFINASTFYDGTITYNGISGYCNVEVDGITVDWVSGNDFSTLIAGQNIYILGILKTINTVVSSTKLTITAGFGGFKNNVTFLAAGPNSHARFKIGLGLSQRTSASDVIRQVRTACRSILIPSPTTGLLQLIPEQTLAQQQSAPISGSNYNTAISSLMPDGTVANGYVAWKFDYSSILGGSGSAKSTLTIDPLDNKSGPNKLSFQFTDEDNQFQQDSLTYTDAVDIIRVGKPIEGTIAANGLMNYDQAERVAAVFIAKNYRGNQRGDSGGTYNISIDTTFKCVHLAVGQLVLFDYPNLNISAGLVDGSSNPINGFLARVTAIKPATNFETAKITVQYHDDRWYLDTFGQSGINLPKASQFRRVLTRPAFPWSPNETQPLAGDPLYTATDWQMGVSQEYSDSAGADPLATLDISGYLPINTFTQLGLAPPSIGAQGNTAATGGTIPGGHTYYFQVCAYDSVGNITMPSDPTAPCVVTVPAGTNTNTITVPIAAWPSGAVNYALFGGTMQVRLSAQKTGSVSSTTSPASITITGYNEDSWGIPDVVFNSIGIRSKPCVHAGTIGVQVASCTSSTIKIAIAGLTVNQFSPISGHPYYITLVGLVSNEKEIPIANWAIASNTTDTFTLAGGSIDPTTISRGDGTVGLRAGDIIIVSMLPTVGSDSIGNYIEDVNFVNAVSTADVVTAISSATNATPIVVTIATDLGFPNGQPILIEGVGGNTAANGTFYASRITGNTYGLYSDAALTAPVAGSGTYTSGGHMHGQGLDLHAEIGNELYCIAGTGAGTYYKISENTNTRIYINGNWYITPDATSVFVINSPSWSSSTESDNVNNNLSTTRITFQLNIPNYLDTLVFVQSFTQDGGGNEAFRAQCPFRIVWVFGQQTAAPGPVVHLTVDGILGIGSDLAPTVRPDTDISALAVRVEVKQAPVGADLTVQLYRVPLATGTPALWMTLTILAGTTNITATPTQIATADTIGAGDNVRLDITAVGTTTPGEDLSATIYGS